MRAAADDDDVVGALERRGAGATCAACGRCHARAAPRRSQGVERPTGAPPSCARRRRRRPSTCTRRAPSRRASGSGRRPRAGRSRACAPPTRGESRRTGSDLRAQVERAEAREHLARQRARRCVSAASAVVTSTRVVDALARAGAPMHERARRASRGHHHAPSRPRRRCRGSSRCGGRADSSSLRRCETSAQADGAAPGVALAGRSRRRRSSRRAPRSCAPAASAWPSIGLRATAAPASGVEELERASRAQHLAVGVVERPGHDLGAQARGRRRRS